ncbi:insulinase family protein [Kingella kingae]|uniref:insulinase family protein n=1 Tax=Kingella kingae TaxID=504 RepID=UPI0012BB7FD0|nr:insulinase family protein [Kingella kingae]MDK4625119.1 insulinase family protein [Kingella kingae]MDK4668755.1 insulinase family protein [Kingella kingae]
MTLHTSLAQTVQHTLNNGLNVIIEEDHRAPVVQTQLWYKVDSMDEQAGKTGLSHALEHIC